MAKEAAVRSPAIYDPFFGARFDSSGQSRVVLIGDASHGTPEFYEARAEITNRLIEHHGSTTVAFEADWPEAKAVDRYVRQNLSDKTSPDLGMFKHSPQWMWRNSETREFVNWLRRHNAQQPSDKRASFNGLDLYTLGLSMRKVIEYLDKVDPKTANVARQTCGSLEPWADDRAEYGREVFRRGMASCEGSVVKMLTDLPKKRLEYAAHDGEDLSDAGRNARLVRGAESYAAPCSMLPVTRGRNGIRISSTLLFVYYSIERDQKPSYGRTIRTLAMPDTPTWARSEQSSILVNHVVNSLARVAASQAAAHIQAPLMRYMSGTVQWK